MCMWCSLSELQNGNIRWHLQIDAVWNPTTRQIIYFTWDFNHNSLHFHRFASGFGARGFPTCNKFAQRVCLDIWLSKVCEKLPILFLLFKIFYFWMESLVFTLTNYSRNNDYTGEKLEKHFLILGTNYFHALMGNVGLLQLEICRRRRRQ